jgi:flavin reductase (DIM6/NTAB) family NADH-FMN oxidoreductase RutF
MPHSKVHVCEQDILLRHDRFDAVPSVGRVDFVNAMARAVTGVSVVTTVGTAGRMAVTVSAVSSVSADPPMVLACINRQSPACKAIRSNGIFCVNVLSADQRHVSDSFAGQPADGRPFDFACACWSAGATGAPKLEGAVATFDCVISASHDAGTHTVFIGRVVGVAEDDGAPLLYTLRSYGRPTLTER